MLFRLLIYALAAYGLYMLFFKDKKITIEDRKSPTARDKKFTDYEEL
ncbi:MAG: hypothetical protein K1X68_08500 [Saprospiraceae bacterium]|nr:hypothetical protein [Saprospiraceae bacterium]HMW39353.1 hypothetical protein [Saprospiraceae bacterium]HMX89521.1 hypothetical protein [Saprospiraceae bacterium]HMZ41334.1 hypothetical protein [Saprospiraceae bacterium]HNA65011.1 hypothetical protein [Saprospiraceae bacterium]